MTLGAWAIRVPPDAVPSGTRLTAQEVVAAGVVGGLRFEPAGTRLLEPAEIRFTWPGTMMLGRAVPVRIFDWEGDRWERASLSDGTAVSAILDADGRSSYFRVDHFSDYAVIATTTLGLETE